MTKRHPKNSIRNLLLRKPLFDRRLAVIMAAFVVVLGFLAVSRILAATGEEVLNAYTTAYTFGDNSPPGNIISNPVIHSGAGGTGTYADPITIAVGYSSSGVMDYPQGTKFYIPNVRRYFIVEDTCAACHTGFPSGTATWVDMWINGQGGNVSAVNNCASFVTDSNGQVHTIIKNPANNYIVVAGSIFNSSTGACTQVFGNTATTSPPPTTAPTPTPTPVTNAADLNADTKINVIDLSILLSHWGQAGTGDVDKNGTVNVIDLSRLLSAWTG